METPQIVSIESSIQEAEGIRTIFLNHSLKANPGQFLMVWIPGMDEKPFAISYLEKNKLGITVAAVGPFSNKLYAMKKNDEVGIRGPYGTGYKLKGKKILMIGGGYGSASLSLFAEQLLRKRKKVKFILGARTKNKLVYVNRINKSIGKENLVITTDDGSCGMKGKVTDAWLKLLEKEHFDMVYACGPDKMLKAITDIAMAKNIKGQINMERWMKCGYGMCGHCCVDPLGIRVCVEGPVIDFALAAKITELGNYHRLKSSRKERL